MSEQNAGCQMRAPVTAWRWNRANYTPGLGYTAWDLRTRQLPLPALRFLPMVRLALLLPVIP